MIYLMSVTEVTSPLLLMAMAEAAGADIRAKDDISRHSHTENS